MSINKIVLTVSCIMLLALGGCSRQQSDWQKTRETNTTDAYEQFLKKYPKGEFTAQAQARAKELYEERDWQKARDADTAEAYQAFLKQYPEGKWTEEARIRVENFTLAQVPSGSTQRTGPAAQGSAAPGASTSGATAAGARAPGATPGGDAAAVADAGNGADETAGVATKTQPAPAVKPLPSSVKPVGKASSGSYRIQLGAFKSGAGAAAKHWADLQKQYPDLLSGLSSKVVAKTTTSGSKLYRLQATGLTERRAHEICEGLKAKSQACVLVPPESG